MEGEDNGDVLQPLARKALHDLIQRSGVGPIESSVNPLAHWTFSESLANVDPDIASLCKSQLKFLQELRQNWRPQHPGKLRFPNDWKPQDSDVAGRKTYGDNLVRHEMDVWVREVQDAFSPLSQEEAIARHHDPASFEPDFLLAVPAHYINREAETPVEKSLRINAEHSLEHFKPTVFYWGGERDAEAAISTAFRCIPGCWLRCAPLFDFPHSVMPSPSPVIDFALLLNTIGPSREFEVRRVRHLRVTLTHPALVVGIKGPALWPPSLAHPTPLERPLSVKEAIQNLAAAVQPSLIAHLLNWQLRREQMPDPCTLHGLGLPVWFMVFGVIYDSERIVIVAHIPFVPTEHSENSEKPVNYPRPRFSYLSCIIDSIPFAPVPATARFSEPWCLDRFRTAFALFTMQRHAFRLASLWESVVWPADIALAEAASEREYLGPTPTPSEDGDALPQHTIDLEEEYSTVSEQQEELDEEIKERDEHAREILPDILQWVGRVAEYEG